jgi:hypothetical protein
MLCQVVDLRGIEADDVAEALAPEPRPELELVVGQAVQHRQGGGEGHLVALPQHLERLATRRQSAAELPALAV